jgi:transcriptional regulator with XRE-family HTH domain
MAVANIELGRQRVPVDVLDRLARALGVDFHELLPGLAPRKSPVERLLPKERTAQSWFGPAQA